MVNGGDNMVRKGRFALANGKEYELISYQRQYYLKSRDALDLQNGFTKLRGNRKEFIKKIDVDDLDDAYEVFSYAMLEGYRFSVEGENYKTGMVALVTSNPFVRGKVNVRPNGNDEYIIELPFEKVDIQEERISILGFESLHPSSYQLINNIKNG